MKKKILFCSISLFWHQLIIAQTKTIVINPNDEEIELIGQTSYLLDSSGKISVQEVSKSTTFQRNTKKSINFGSNQSYLWLKFKLLNYSDSTRRFSLVSKGVDSLHCYQIIDSTHQIVKDYLTGSHISFNEREYPSPYLTFSIELLPKQVNTIYVRIRNVNYPLSVSPFKLYSQKAAKAYLKQNDLLQSIYIGSMLFLLMFGSALLLFFREWLYFYYLVCVFLSMSMMLVYNDYYYLIFDKVPEIIRSKNFYGIPTSLAPMFYLFFAKEFLIFGYDKNGYLKRLTRGISIITVLTITVFIVFSLNIYQYRNIFYVLIFALCSLTHILLFRSLNRKYKPAWFFLAATVPVLLMGFWETLSDFHHTPVQDIHRYYYASTMFEMYVLTLGLALKFKIAQDEKNQLQAEVFAIETQVQETERQRIAQDLHDKLGGLLGALTINLSVLTKNKQLQKQEVDSLNKSLEMLNLTSEEVRNISHSLASSTLTKLGLVAMLMEMYQNTDNPKVNVQNNGFLTRLESSKEMALYAIIQECINNARKHAYASEISICFKQNADKLTVMVEDDGKGFEITNSINKGNGLENISFRIKEHLRGELLIDSGIGRGTVVMIKTKVG